MDIVDRNGQRNSGKGPDPFKDSKLSIARAREHIADLRDRILAYARSEPHTKFVEFDSEGSYELHKIKFIKPLPEDLISVTADAINNLRQALDLAVYVALGATERVNPRRSKFPFAENAKAFEKDKIYKEFPAEIKPLFRSLRPYRGGNDYLWAFNDIRNKNQHRWLNPMMVACRGSSEVSQEMRSEFGVPLGKWDPVNQEVIFAIFMEGKRAEYDGTLTFAVKFGQVEVVRDRPVIEILNIWAGMIESIVSKIEQEARRLGYI